MLPLWLNYVVHSVSSAIKEREKEREKEKEKKKRKIW
jgi:hypothetical protein